MPSKLRRLTLKHLAGASLLTGAGCGGLLRAALANGGQPLAPGLRKLTGEVTVNGRPAQPGMAVGAGDTVVTGRGGEAIYVIGQDAFLQRENTTISFPGAAVDVMRVLSGRILSVFGKGAKRIETTTATIGIRGTGCYIECQPEQVYFCLCYGAADISPLADPTHVERIVTTHHDHPLLIGNGAARPMMADASVINHSDAELELLENLVGRQPPFSAGGYRY